MLVAGAAAAPGTLPWPEPTRGKVLRRTLTHTWGCVDISLFIQSALLAVRGFFPLLLEATGYQDAHVNTDV